MREGSSSAEHRVRVARQGSDWLSLLLIAAFAALIGTAGYFAFRYMDRSTYNDARAFRVLDELVSQFENFQQTMVSLLALVPENQSNRDKYAKTWVLPKLELTGGDEKCQQKDALQEPAKFELLRRESDLPFTVSRCVEVEGETYLRLQLTGAMRAQLPAFASQDFFDVALIGSRHGEMLIDISRRGDALGTMQIQQTRSAGVPIVDIGDLLRRGELEIIRNQTKKAQKDEDVELPQFAAPAHPVVFQERIGGETYRIYVIAFRPPIATELPAPPTPTANDHGTSGLLYVVGLKRQNWGEQLSTGLGPSGSLAISVVVLLVIVLWPLVSLRFAAPQDPIPHMQVVALATAAMLLPAILTVTAVWAWNNLHLRNWADSGAEVYAQQIEDVLRADLNESARLLTDYGPALYESNGTALSLFPKSRIRLPRADRTTQVDPDACQETTPATLADPVMLNVARKRGPCALRNWSPLRSVAGLDLDGGRLGRGLNALGALHSRKALILDDRATQLDPDTCQKTTPATLADPVMLRVVRQPQRCALRNWSPLRSVAGLDLDGGRLGHGLTAFGALPSRKALALADREYFKAVRDFEEWRPDELWPAPFPTQGFVAQRLFSRGDAARVLQIAVPIEHDKQRVGVAIGDTRAYAISAAIRVPLLRFAIVNASNGAVLFHSNDERSLAENFLLETEDDPSLQRALTRRASTRTMNTVSREDHFSGEYVGTAHRFFFRPVAGMPWGIVVFYPLPEIAQIAQQAAIAALASYMCIVISLVAVMIVVFAMLPKRSDLLLLALLWPRWDARTSYRGLACCLGVIIALVIALLMWELNGQDGPQLYGWAIAAETGIALCLLCWQAARDREMTLRTYHAWYLACMVLLMLLISALPAAWMTATYQDIALRAYFRDQLTLAATDVERRESTIRRDLRRWVADDKGTSIADYPSAKVLSAILSSPGYRSELKTNNRCTVWTVTAFDRQPWMSASGPRKLGYFGRTMWAMSIDSNLQRAGRTTALAPGPDSSSASAAQAGLCGSGETSVPFWRRRYDGAMSKLAVPVVAPQPLTPLKRDPDIDTHYRYSPAGTAVGLLLILLLILTLISWTLARRLFGIRIPFASRYVDRDSIEAMPIEPLLTIELYIARMELKEGRHFTTKDGDDIRMAKCEATYLEIWKKRSKDDRLLLHQLAEGKFANPENRAVIERLLHLGYLKLDPWPKIADRGLAAYARHAEKDSLFEKWQRAASSNAWNRIRTPLLLVVIVVVGVLMWVAGSTMQILSATLAGMATLFGYVTQVTNLFKKGEERPRAE